jgi:hypothetical protein
VSEALDSSGTGAYRPRQVLVGREEPIFDALPGTILANLHQPASESALVWNLIYPLARDGVALSQLMSLRPLWGPPCSHQVRDQLSPYFWGYGVDGERLPGLDETLRHVDGAGPKTEVDLLLIGEEHLVVAEAKHTGGLGRCSRYARRRCPEVHQPNSNPEPCRYWESRGQRFSQYLNFGPRPENEEPPPLCYRHYQLARTLLVGRELASWYGLELHLWLLIPQLQWHSIERSWLDFMDRIKDDGLWRNSRVIAWQDIRALNP